MLPCPRGRNCVGDVGTRVLPTRCIPCSACVQLGHTRPHMAPNTAPFLPTAHAPLAPSCPAWLPAAQPPSLPPPPAAATQQWQAMDAIMQRELDHGPCIGTRASAHLSTHASTHRWRPTATHGHASVRVRLSAHLQDGLMELLLERPLLVHEGPAAAPPARCGGGSRCVGLAWSGAAHGRTCAWAWGVHASAAHAHHRSQARGTPGTATHLSEPLWEGGSPASRGWCANSAIRGRGPIRRGTRYPVWTLWTLWPSHGGIALQQMAGSGQQGTPSVLEV